MCSTFLCYSRRFQITLMEWSLNGGKPFTAFPFERNPQWKPEIAFIHDWINYSINIRQHAFIAYDLITAQMNSKSLLIIVISLRTTCHSQKENDSQRRCYLKFLIHDCYCNKSSFELEKTRSYCSQEIYISLSHRMIKWRDDLIKQFTKPSPLILENN